MGTNYGSRNVTWLDATLHPGYVMNWNVTIEYQLSANNLFKVFYAGSAGVDLVESWNMNAFPTDFRASNPALQAAAFANPQAYLPYPQFGSIMHMSNTGHSTYHAVTIQYSKRYSEGLVLDSFYTYSKALDDCDSDYGTCTGVAPVADRNLNKRRAGYDMRHRFVTSLSYELPVGKGRRYLNQNRFLDFAIGGYDISWIQTIDTGNPFGFTFANSPYKLLSDEHRRARSQPCGHARDGAVWVRERHWSQPLQSIERIRCGGRRRPRPHPSRRAMPDAIS